jgi:hypothetical protein
LNLIEFVYSYTLAGAKKSKATNDTVTDEPLLTIVCCARDTKKRSFSMSTREIPSQSKRRK